MPGGRRDGPCCRQQVSCRHLGLRTSARTRGRGQSLDHGRGRDRDLGRALDYGRGRGRGRGRDRDREPLVVRRLPRPKTALEMTSQTPNPAR